MSNKGRRAGPFSFAVAAWIAVAMLLGNPIGAAGQNITEVIDVTGDGMGNALDFPEGIAVDDFGNVYMTGAGSDNAFKITPGGVITQIIDGTGDGMGNMLDLPEGIAVDSSGNVYVAGAVSDNAFKITPGGVITQIIDATGDGAGNTLDAPRGIAVDDFGNVYVPGAGSNNAFKIRIPLQFGLDHFLSYRAKTTRGTPKFQKILGLNLTDQFEMASFDIQKPVAICNPGDKNNEGIVDLDTHLVNYKIKPGEGQPTHVRQTNIRVDNQLGVIIVDTTRPERLLVPTAKDLIDLPLPPVPDDHNVDNYKCYKIKVRKKICQDDPSIKCKTDADCPGACNLGFPKGVQVMVVDQFQERIYDVQKPGSLCTPVDLEGGGIKNPETHLMCYRVKPAKGEPKHDMVTGININNELGPLQLDTIKEEELCVPSLKKRFNPRAGS
jgi:hypothetical protein